MALRCCKCGQQSSSSSSRSASSGSGSGGSQSQSGSGGVTPTPCGACYAYPATWNVGIKGEWFVYNPAATYAVNCAFPLGYVYRDLFYHAPGPTGGAKAWAATRGLTDSDICQAWWSVALATFVSAMTCDGELIVAVCPENGISQPLVELVAYQRPGNKTLFMLFVWWTTCRGGVGSFETAEGYVWELEEEAPTAAGISCVRSYGLSPPAPNFTADAFGNPAYNLSGTDLSWATVQIDPV